jgi:omega-amidase
MTTKTSLSVTLVQPNLVWENKSANLAKIEGMLDNIGQTDLIVLPEMFTTGFTMNVETLAETMQGQTVNWLKEKARQWQSAIVGSIIIEEEGRYFNRLVWVTPEQEVSWYDKRHLFSMGEEHLHFTPGNQRVTVEWKGWKIRLLICYDLRFPVWSRNHDDYDLLIYTANWPSARHHVWKSLLTARALENQSWCIGVNRIGKDGMGLEYLGDSGCIDAHGEAVWLGEVETTRTFTLSLSKLNAFRQKFPIMKDRDWFIL